MMNNSFIKKKEVKGSPVEMGRAVERRMTRKEKRRA